MKKWLFSLAVASILSSCMDNGGEKNAPDKTGIDDTPTEVFPKEEAVEIPEPDESVDEAKKNIEDYYKNYPEQRSKKTDDFLKKMQSKVEEQVQDLPEVDTTPISGIVEKKPIDTAKSW